MILVKHIIHVTQFSSRTGFVLVTAYSVRSTSDENLVSLGNPVLLDTADSSFERIPLVMCDIVENQLLQRNYYVDKHRMD